MENKVFKNSGGKWITKGLFFELTTPDTREYCVYTLKEEDMAEGYKSLKLCYMSCDDPTEYTFATKYLGGWSHWKELQKTVGLSTHIENWREEKRVQLRSKGVTKLVELASSEESSFQAAKWLAEEGWKEPNTKGRPTKEQIKSEAKAIARQNSRAEADHKRLFN